jgi:DNA-binding response OmpR family regulator
MKEALRVLLVDDDVELTDIATELFAAHGIVVDACPSGSEAMRTVATKSYDAVVTDLKLAHGESGLELCRSLSSAWPDLLIVVLSGDISAKDRAFALGARAFFAKPVELIEVSEFIRGARGSGPHSAS